MPARKESEVPKLEFMNAGQAHRQAHRRKRENEDAYGTMNMES